MRRRMNLLPCFLLAVLIALSTSVRVDAVIGDLNLDGKVDLVDFFIFADNFSAQGPPDTLRVTVYDTVLVTVCDTVTVVDLPEWEVVFSDNFDRSDGGPGGDWSVQVFSTTGEAATIAVADDQFAVPGGASFTRCGIPHRSQAIPYASASSLQPWRLRTRLRWISETLRQPTSTPVLAW